MSIKVHIERLILEGLPVARAHAPLVQQAVERELARLLATGGLALDLAVGGAVADVPAGPLRTPRAGNSLQLGGQIARSIYKGNGR